MGRASSFNEQPWHLHRRRPKTIPQNMRSFEPVSRSRRTRSGPRPHHGPDTSQAPVLIDYAEGWLYIRDGAQVGCDRQNVSFPPH